MAAVRRRMTYETGSTHVRTVADEALSAGHGVCQDFAHVIIGVCRLHGIPSRYVSGYLFDPRATGDGYSALHAWVDVWDPDRGWVSLDPTHDREQTARYVRVGVGRDYADVPPTRGVYKGKAKEDLRSPYAFASSEPGSTVLRRRCITSGPQERSGLVRCPGTFRLFAAQAGGASTRYRDRKAPVPYWLPAERFGTRH